MKYLLVFCLFAMLGAGCIKNDQGCKNATPESEEAQIKAYAAANGIKATKHNSGVFYEIVNAGTGVAPALNSKVYITYTGKLLNGSVFDQLADHTKSGWQLRSLIEGWQIGMPLIKEGGKIKLIIPSALGYGCIGAGFDIPSNAPLFFEIDLVDVQ